MVRCDWLRKDGTMTVNTMIKHAVTGRGERVVLLGCWMLVAFAVLGVSDRAQAQNQTQAQAREQLLKEINAGQLRDAVLLGQQSVSRWPRDAEIL